MAPLHANERILPVGNRLAALRRGYMNFEGQWSGAVVACATAPAYRDGGLLFVDHASRRRARRLFRWRDHECDPSVPAIGPVLVGEFPVAFEIEITLHLSGQGDDEPDLRPGAHHLRLEATHPVAGAGVATQLSVDIADDANLNLLGQELRRAPIEMHVDAILILGRLVGEIVGEAEHA